MTNRFIDYINGDDSWSGAYSTPQNGDGPWKTLTKAVGSAGLHPGDVGYVRWNQTHTYSSGSMMTYWSGTIDSPIIIMADDGTGWAGDSHTTKPIIDFADSTVYLMLFDPYWYFIDLDFRNSHNASPGAAIHSYMQCGRNRFIRCVFQDNLHRGVYAEIGECIFIECEFDGNELAHIHSRFGRIYCKDCTFEGIVTANTGHGLYIECGFVECIDCTFGVATEHDGDDVNVADAGLVRLRNCDLSTSGREVGIAHPAGTGAEVHAEDHQQVKGAHKSWYVNGTVEKDTGVVHSGGADSSAKMLPNAYCGELWPLTITRNAAVGDFQIWCQAEETTVTVYIRGCGTWTTPPDATQLYILAEYWNDGGSAERVESTHSTQTLDGDNWVAFTTTFTPVAEGWAYVKVVLGLYEDDGDGIYVDIKPVVS